MTNTRQVCAPLPLTIFADLKRVLAMKGSSVHQFIYAAAADLVERPDFWQVRLGRLERVASDYSLPAEEISDLPFDAE